MTNYVTVTEMSGDYVSQEQVDRLCHRYYWAKDYCMNKDVLEVACGSGQGIGYINEVAHTYIAGDYSHEVLEVPKNYYKDKVNIMQFDAQKMPFADNSFDIVIIFEAIYYLPAVDQFIRECRRVLKDNGKVLIATANKDLYDFNPSPFSYKYFGVLELKQQFLTEGFNSVECFGNTATDEVSIRQKILRPIKKIAVGLKLVPKTTSGKKYLKRIFFGKLVPMPYEIKEGMSKYSNPTKLDMNVSDKRFKVIYSVATVKKGET